MGGGGQEKRKEGEEKHGSDGDGRSNLGWQEDIDCLRHLFVAETDIAIIARDAGWLSFGYGTLPVANRFGYKRE